MRAALVFLLLALPAVAAPLSVHVTVALCDNATQGIVPVPPAIGNGHDPRTNLYWGAMYGLKSWLKYTLTAAIDAHVRGADVKEAAARAYDRHQKCGIKAARRLFR